MKLTCPLSYNQFSHSPFIHTFDIKKYIILSCKFYTETNNEFVNFCDKHHAENSKRYVCCLFDRTCSAGMKDLEWIESRDVNITYVQCTLYRLWTLNHYIKCLGSSRNHPHGNQESTTGVPQCKWWSCLLICDCMRTPPIFMFVYFFHSKIWQVRDMNTN